MQRTAERDNHARVDTDLARERFDLAVRTHKQEYENFFLARLLNLEFSYGEATCEIRFRAETFMLNPQGNLHGGIICLVMDACMGHLLNHVGTPGITLEIKTQYVRAIQEGSLCACASFIKQGRSMSYLKCELSSPEGQLYAFATATWRASSVRVVG